MQAGLLVVVRGTRGFAPKRTGEILGFVPTVLRSGPYRVYFYSHEPGEPAHVHVDRDDLSAKFWLRPLALARTSALVL